MILDREYQFMCAPEERAALREAAELLDARMRDIKAQGNLMALERIAVMAALNISFELLHASRETGAEQSEADQYKNLNAKLDDALYDLRQLQLN